MGNAGEEGRQGAEAVGVGCRAGQWEGIREEGRAVAVADGVGELERVVAVGSKAAEEVEAAEKAEAEVAAVQRGRVRKSAWVA